MGPIEERLTSAKGFVEKGWTRYHEARGPQGIPTHPSDPGACQWCAIGALDAAKNASEDKGATVQTHAGHILAEAAGQKPPMVPHAWTEVVETITNTNDNHMANQAETLDWFESAIKLAHERGL